MERDFKIILGHGQESKVFRAASGVLKVSSPAWAAMTDPQGNFREARTKTIRFEHDDPAAMLLILKWLHAEPIPTVEELSMELLCNAGMIANKYMMLQTMQPCLSAWVYQLRTAAAKPDAQEKPGEWILALCLAGEDHHPTMIATARIFIQYTAVDETGQWVGSQGLTLKVSEVAEVRRVYGRAKSDSARQVKLIPEADHIKSDAMAIVKAQTITDIVKTLLPVQAGLQSLLAGGHIACDCGGRWGKDVSHGIYNGRTDTLVRIIETCHTGKTNMSVGWLVVALQSIPACAVNVVLPGATRMGIVTQNLAVLYDIWTQVNDITGPKLTEKIEATIVEALQS